MVRRVYQALDSESHMLQRKLKIRLVVQDLSGRCGEELGEQKTKFSDAIIKSDK